ncbi:MAG: altronate dehydratase family protein [Bacillota bacterium]|nr:altronate dehydratase family protein [Bacillota bacterium]
MDKLLRIHPNDNVAVALEDIKSNEETIKRGHKMALCDIKTGEQIIKYGHSIGHASCDIKKGSWVHSHNMVTNLSAGLSYVYEPYSVNLSEIPAAKFMGYKRPDNRVGIRNELWIIPLVGCVNDVCKEIESRSKAIALEYGLDGVYHFPHPYGCSQLGDDMKDTRTILSDLCKHPNAGAVLCVALGCENNTLEEFKAELGTEYNDKIRFMVCQDESDELETAAKLVEELCEYASKFKRTQCDASDLVIGLKCGGSDGLSGITANPTVGRFSDKLVAMGGTTILTEIPEMFGAETDLLNRCKTKELFDKASKMINDFKDYFISHGQPVGENPSPGNKEGGITTLEDKSSGCVQKGGIANVNGVLFYGERAANKGLNMLCAPGNDLVSSTALAAAGAQIVLFTTGRGTPFSAPVPTIKISTNNELYNKKQNWIDINSGEIAEGKDIDLVAEELFNYVINVASGNKTKSERNNQHGLAIWKNGVTL